MNIPRTTIEIISLNIHFTLSKIHKWITKWSDTEIIHPNAWSSLFIGTSAFLESIVAKMRSKILDEKRPGSIIVDGGGKITLPLYQI